MKTEVLRVADPENERPAIAAIVERLRRQEVVAIPTETVYGLAALPAAAEALRAAKGRGADKPFTWAVASLDAATALGDLSALPLAKLARRFWPGPLTLVAPRKGGGTIGLRVPGHKVALAILRELGEPLLLTSANESGQPDARNAGEVLAALDGRVPLVVDGGPAQIGDASAVVERIGRRIVVHREGVIDRAMILKTAARQILFVCSGNTCRSPMAEHVARKLFAEALGTTPAELLEHGIALQSAGTSAHPRMHASEETIDLLRARGIDATGHRSRTLDAALVKAADHVFTMTAAHRRAVLAAVPDAAAKTELLDPSGNDVPDPIGGGVEVYRDCLETIEGALRKRIARMV